MKRFRADMPLVAVAILLGAWSAPVLGKADKTTFHQDARRSGWNDDETVLTPQTVAGGRFGQIWQSPPLDASGDVPPRLFASPLYLGSVAIADGPGKGRTLSVAYVVTSTGYVYAINARASAGLAAGAILWRARLTDKPCDGGAMGNLSTPVRPPSGRRQWA